MSKYNKTKPPCRELSTSTTNMTKEHTIWKILLYQTKQSKQNKQPNSRYTCPIYIKINDQDGST
jgi:hypothetical protein